MDFLIDILRKNPEKELFVWKDEISYCKDVLNWINYWQDVIHKNCISSGEVIAIESESSPSAISLMIALIMNKSIVVPLSKFMQKNINEFYEIAEVDKVIALSNQNEYEIKVLQPVHVNKLINKLKELNNPGLILFSSGTSGKSKGALHDLSKLLTKYTKPRKDHKTLAFMYYDHIGGIDTIFYSLSNASLLCMTEDRTPVKVCYLIEKYKLEVLPTTPSFLNMLILSEEYKKYDLSSLKYITYGTEPMPEFLLKKMNELFPEVVLLQKYGTTEVGTLRSKSKSNTSTWVKIGGEGYETKIVDDILYIKAESAMMGYLNAPSPFTEDGWFITGDKVEVDGDYYRILGRDSEIINVGGEKVYPAEVEAVLNEMPEIAESTVFGEQNPLLGNIVCAEIILNNKELKGSEIKNQIKNYCLAKLQPYKVPVKIKFVEEFNISERFKKMRSKKND